jgi:hypothetical protein
MKPRRVLLVLLLGVVGQGARTRIARAIVLP